MARVTKIEKINKEGRVHNTTTECSYFLVSDEDGKTYLTLETYGSEGRKIPGKISQTIQFNEEVAGQLKKIIEETFSGLD